MTTDQVREQDRHHAISGLRHLLRFLGYQPESDGLKDTPRRVVDALESMTAGHKVDVEALLSRTFEVQHSDAMIVVRGVEFHSLCEHHLMGFSGVATVGYIPGPNQRVVGLSKLARLVKAYAMRLQVQERMTGQILAAIVEHLEPLGAGVIVTATHSCMRCRGALVNGEMVTSGLHGAMRTDPEVRAEFMRLHG